MVRAMEYFTPQTPYQFISAREIEAAAFPFVLVRVFELKRVWGR